LVMELVVAAGRDSITQLGNARDTRQTRVTGTGFWRVGNCQPVPVPVTTRDLNPCGFANP